MDAAGIRELIVGFARRVENAFRAPLTERSFIAGAHRGRLVPALLAFVTLVLVPNMSNGGVLSESDFRKVEEIKPLFQNLMGDLVQTSKRSDISSGDADCIISTIRELLQISDELSSYEYLITIEKEMTDFGDKSPMQGVVKFAIEKSTAVLAGERKRLVQLSDRCARFPLAIAKMQQTLQFVDTTIKLLNSIQVRL
ncbi:MAG: hypothetical protein Q8M18_07805 [Bradyrhizobium sp.]|nr:hypothetical protein [Bradyrhizobium sp.]